MREEARATPFLSPLISPPPSCIPQAVKFQRGSELRESSLRVGVARGLGTTLSPQHNDISQAAYTGIGRDPGVSEVKPHPGIVSCPRDRRASRHSCQRESAPTGKISTPKLRHSNSDGKRAQL